MRSLTGYSCLVQIAKLKHRDSYRFANPSAMRNANYPVTKRATFSMPNRTSPWLSRERLIQVRQAQLAPIVTGARVDISVRSRAPCFSESQPYRYYCSIRFPPPFRTRLAILHMFSTCASAGQNARCMLRPNVGRKGVVAQGCACTARAWQDALMHWTIRG